MDLKQPKLKAHSSSKTNSHPALPLMKNSRGEITKFHGRFNGFAVLIDDEEEQEKLHSMGCFGKGNLSRSFPNRFPKKSSQMIRRRQFDNRANIDERLDLKRNCTTQKVLVIDDSDSEDFLSNVKANYCLSYYNLKEHLQLSLVEAYYLKCYVNCLEVRDDGKHVTNDECWQLFCEVDDFFVQKYAAYHYFRSKNWIVKSGIKFGVDFLLYKDGPFLYHASYLVKIDVIEDETQTRMKELSGFSEKTAHCHGLNRIASNTAKDLLIFQIFWPADLTMNDTKQVDCIEKFSVKEIILRRWKPTQNS